MLCCGVSTRFEALGSPSRELLGYCTGRDEKAVALSPINASHQDVLSLKTVTRVLSLVILMSVLLC